MSRNAREHFIGGRSLLVGTQHRSGRSLTRISKDSDENLDLFAKNRRSLSVASSDDSSDVSSIKLGRLSVGSLKLARSGIDDLLASTEGGKHDYDWLLTPPETPLFPSCDGSDSQPASVAPKGTSSARSASTTKASRLSVSQSESNFSSRPTRSNSVTQSSICTLQYSTYSSNRSSSILNKSSSSVTSYTRPSSPVTRSPSIVRSFTPTPHPALSRSSTPSRVRSSPTNSSIDRPRPLQNSRPSTPSSRPQVPANLGSPASRSNSRPTTPTRCSPTSSVPVSTGPPTAAARAQSNGRNPAPVSRPSSPGPRVRPPPQPIVPPDFPLDTPPNLRTTLPDRPISAGRSRPVSSAVKGNSETPASVSVPRRTPSPVITRGRRTDPPGRARINANGHHNEAPELRRGSHASESVTTTRKPAKALTTTAESTGFGRTISKKSLDMAIRHMDIRNGTGSIRPLSGTTLYPQSIRSVISKTHSIRGSSAPPSINGDLHNANINGVSWEQGKHFQGPVENGSEANDAQLSAKLNEVDIYESSRYDAIFLKEDLKNTNWLHSIDDKVDTEAIFDNGFESLPEPFGLL